MDAVLFFTNPYVSAWQYWIMFVCVFFIAIGSLIVGVFFYLKYKIIGFAQKKYTTLHIQAKKKKFEQQKSKVLKLLDETKFVKGLLLFFTRRYDCSSIDQCSDILDLKKTQKQTIKDVYYRNESMDPEMLNEIKKKLKKMTYVV